MLNQTFDAFFVKAKNIGTTIGIATIINVLVLLLGFNVAAAAQQQGAASSQEKDSSAKADQNLKSLARINPSTLAMELSLPLMSYPGRGGNGLPVGLSYSSKLWRMDAQQTYFNTSPGGSRQYITQLRSLFGERSAAGWTSSIAFPVIEEKLDIYEQTGNSFNYSIGETLLNSNFQSFLDSFSNSTPSQLMNLNSRDCGYSCALGLCPLGGGANPECICVEWRANSCPTSGGGGGGGGYDGGGTVNTPQPRMHYVKRVRVRMGGGAVHEFRKSDVVFGYCTGGAYDGPNCEPGSNNFGTFLSVDGSGMRLERSASGSTLFLPDGSSYKFTDVSTDGYDGTNLYQAFEFIDADGNRTRFVETTDNNGKIIDTVGREVSNLLPKNLLSQTQQAGTKQIALSGLNGTNQTYEIKWSHLKPVGCEISTDPNCGGGTGALENQNQKVFY